MNMNGGIHQPSFCKTSKKGHASNSAMKRLNQDTESSSLVTSDNSKKHLALYY